MRINTNRPMDYNLLSEHLAQMQWEFPFACFFDIGKSIFGRQLHMVRLGKGHRTVFINAAHHGSEWMTSMQLLNFCNAFCQAAEDGLSLFGYNCRLILKKYTLFLMPMVNPDGVCLAVNGLSKESFFYERILSMNGGSTDFTHWQANGRGVDLNHNYDAGFYIAKELEPSYGVTAPCPSRYGGSFPESEPEVAAICDFVRKNGIDVAVALHSQGEEIYYDYCGHIPRGARKYAHAMANASGYTLSKPDGIASYSGFKDWFIDKFDRPAFTIEIGLGQNPLPLCDFGSIYRKLAPMLLSLCP